MNGNDNGHWSFSSQRHPYLPNNQRIVREQGEVRMNRTSAGVVSEGSFNAAPYRAMTQLPPLERSRLATPTHGLPNCHNQPGSTFSQQFGPQNLAAGEYPLTFTGTYPSMTDFSKHSLSDASYISKQAEGALMKRVEAVELRSSQEQAERITLNSRLDKATNELDRVVRELDYMRSQLNRAIAPGRRRDEPPQSRSDHAGPAVVTSNNLASRRTHEHMTNEGGITAGEPGVSKTANPPLKRSSLGTESEDVGACAKRARRAHPTAAAAAAAAEAEEEGLDDDDYDDDGLEWGCEFLRFIKAMDCTSEEDLLRLQRYVRGRAALEFPLCSETGDSRVVEYFLKVGGLSSTLIAADPHDRPEQPKEDEARVERLNVLEFAVDERMARHATTAPKVAAGSSSGRGGGPGGNKDQDVQHDGIGLPEYLVPLGEVYAANRSLNRPQEVGSTNFFVLMQVDGPKKSLWMVYRYMRSFKRKNGPVWDAVAPGSQRDAHFKGCRRMFDTVCLLDDVRDWKDSAQDMVTMEHLAEAVPGDERAILQPIFFVPVLTVLRKALRKGWKDAGNEN